MKNSVGKILRLSNELRSKNFNKQADELEYQFLILKKSESDLYSVFKETGEGLIDQSHPQGSHLVEEASDELGVVETISDQHKKILDSLDNAPKASRASLVEYIQKSAFFVPYLINPAVWGAVDQIWDKFVGDPKKEDFINETIDLISGLSQDAWYGEEMDIVKQQSAIAALTELRNLIIKLPYIVNDTPENIQKYIANISAVSNSLSQAKSGLSFMSYLPFGDANTAWNRLNRISKAALKIATTLSRELAKKPTEKATTIPLSKTPEIEKSPAQTFVDEKIKIVEDLKNQIKQRFPKNKFNPPDAWIDFMNKNLDKDSSKWTDTTIENARRLLTKKQVEVK